MRAKRVHQLRQRWGKETNENSTSRLTRRDFIRLTGVTIAAASMARCGPGQLWGSRSTPLPPPTQTPLPPPTQTPFPAPRDIPIFRTSFEDIADLSAIGITASGSQPGGNDTEAVVKITRENVDYAGGKQALEISGTLPPAADSRLNMDFAIEKLTREKTIDLTDKALAFSAFIPADSAIDDIALYAGKSAAIVLLADVRADEYWNKGAWHDYRFDLSQVQGLQGYIKDCDTIRIAGRRLVDGEPTAAQFLVDDMMWIRRDTFNLPLDDSIDSLRKYAAGRHFKFGLFAAPDIVFGPDDEVERALRDTVYDLRDPWYAYLCAQEGTINAVTNYSPEPNEDYSVFDYDRPEDAKLVQQYEFGRAYHMDVLGYGIGGVYYTVPKWLRDLAFPDATRELLLYHIEKDLRYTKGQNPIWLLFNEAIQSIEYGNSGLRNRRNPIGVNQWGGTEWDYSPWAGNTTDSSIIKAAFVKAREVDPGATLLLNDFEDEEIGLKKSEYLFEFASGLQDEGIPIDGVGWQLHNFIDPDGKLFFARAIPFTYESAAKEDLDTYLGNVDLNVKRYAARGLKVAFTEVEGQIKVAGADLTTPAGRTEYEKRLQWQAEYFAGLLKLALRNENVILFQCQGATDKYHGDQPWPGYGNGFIFDKRYNPKPAYYAMLDLLEHS